MSSLLVLVLLVVAVAPLPVLPGCEIALVERLPHNLKAMKSGFRSLATGSAHLVEPGVRLALLLYQLVQVR